MEENIFEARGVNKDSDVADNEIEISLRDNFCCMCHVILICCRRQSNFSHLMSLRLRNHFSPSAPFDSNTGQK